MAMEERHLIATYCRFREDDEVNTFLTDYSKIFPKHVLNRIDKAKETYIRLYASHPDKEYIKITFFGHQAIEGLKKYATSIGLPEEKIELDSDCKNIAAMAKKIWERVRSSAVTPRVYFVVSNWQWIFLEPLTSIKDDRYKFYLEGALDERHPDEMELDKKSEKVAKIDLKEGRIASILDKVGGSISSNLKG